MGQREHGTAGAWDSGSMGQREHGTAGDWVQQEGGTAGPCAPLSGAGLLAPFSCFLWGQRRAI